MSNKISVIVPVYNAERYIKRCADSILNQTHRNIELILVNDGSGDSSLEICRAIAEQDSRVIVFDKKNGGAASARNVGLDHATGDYVGFCDADDYLDLDMYETLLGEMEVLQCETIDCTAKDFDQNGHLISSASNTGEVLVQTSQDAIKLIFLRKGNVSVATRLFKANIFLDLRFPEGHRVEDFYITIMLLSKVRKNYILFRPFYNCVASVASVTRSATGSIYLDALYFYNRAIEDLKKIGLSFPREQEYYLLKMYYLLSASATAEEWKKYKIELNDCQIDLRRHFWSICRNPYLKFKERVGLYFACFNMRWGRVMYLLKNYGGKR